MNMELLEKIIKIGASSLSLIVFAFSVVMFTLNKIKKHKNGICESEAQDEIALLKDIIPFAIEKAEQLNVDGSVKRVLALSDILLNCQNANIDYNKYKDFIEQQLEELISFSKDVNKRDKDKLESGANHD